MKIWSEIPLQKVLPSLEWNEVSYQNVWSNCQKRLSFAQLHRQVLHEVLTEQNTISPLSSLGQENIELLLRENTVTITTGQQIVTAGGPWMILYKIASAIQQARFWNEKVSDFHFVPVFWMASEDHDWNEIAQLSRDSNALSFTTTQKGAVGRMSIDEVMKAFDQWNVDFPEYPIPEIVIECYGQSSTISKAFQRLIQLVFKDTELVIVDPDHPKLKSLFLPWMKKEIEDNFAFEWMSEHAIINGEVEVKNGNLFYLGNGDRKRIDFHSESKSHWISLLQQSPQDFSPGVVLRPLFQEIILPNVMYIGGPSECRYWQQLSPWLRHELGFTPAVMLRDRGWMIHPKWLQKWEQASWSIEQWNWSEQQWKEYFESRWHPFPNPEQRERLIQVFQQWAEEIQEEDASLTPFILGEQKKLMQSLDHIQSKVMRSRKNRDEVIGNWFNKWKQQAFPFDRLQERQSYWIWDWAQGGLDIESLIQSIDPQKPTYKIWSN